MSLFQKATISYHWGEHISTIHGKVNSAVHCYYYSCFQLILHILDSRYHAIPKFGNEGSHEATLTLFISKMSNDSKVNISPKDLHDLANFTTILKDFRRKSDYKPDFLKTKEYTDVKEKAQRIVSVLTSNYELPWK